MNLELLDVQAGFRSQRNQRSNCQHPLDHRKSKGIPKIIHFCFIDYAKAFDSVDHNKLWKILKEMGILDHLTCFLRNLYAGQEATVRTRHGTTHWLKIGKGVHQGWILSPCLFNLYALVHPEKSWARWLTSWNQDFWEKYQQPQIYSWYHFNSRKWRWIKELLYEGERGKWKGWLKTQHSKN